MTISELVREYRATHNISQRQFADIAGLSNGYVSMIENNINPATGMPPKLSLNTLKKVGGGVLALGSIVFTVGKTVIDISKKK